MDAEDRERTLSNKEKLLRFLKERGSCTNEQARRVAGSRALGRCHELIKEGHPITVRKIKGAIWELRYDMPPMARDAGTRAPQKSLPMVLPFQW